MFLDRFRMAPHDLSFWGLTKLKRSVKSGPWADPWWPTGWYNMYHYGACVYTEISCNIWLQWKHPLKIGMNWRLHLCVILIARALMQNYARFPPTNATGSSREILPFFKCLLHLDWLCSFNNESYSQLYCPFPLTVTRIWRFPKIGVPPNHPVYFAVFHEINHLFWSILIYFGDPQFMESSLNNCTNHLAPPGYSWWPDGSKQSFFTGHGLASRPMERLSAKANGGVMATEDSFASSNVAGKSPKSMDTLW